MPVLSRNEILKAPDIQRERVYVPEWGGDVFVKGMTGAERDKFEGSILSLRGKSQQVNLVNLRAKLAALTICDEEGNRLFTDEDIQALSQKSAAGLQRVFAVAQRLSGLGEDDVKELTEGLQESPFGDSPTG
jgi:hypothetical protein